MLFHLVHQYLVNLLYDKTLSLCSLMFGFEYQTYCICKQFWGIFAGYGFVDFESPSAAEVAVQALQSQGIQAQMAKVGQSKISTCILSPPPLSMSQNQ